MTTRFVAEIFDGVIWSVRASVPVLFIYRQVEFAPQLSALHCHLGRASNCAWHMCHSSPPVTRLIWALIRLPAGLLTLPCAISMARRLFYGVERYQCKCLCGSPSIINHCQSLLIGQSSTQCVTLTWVEFDPFSWHTPPGQIGPKLKHLVKWDRLLLIKTERFLLIKTERFLLVKRERLLLVKRETGQLEGACASLHLSLSHSWLLSQKLQFQIFNPNS